MNNIGDPELMNELMRTLGKCDQLIKEMEEHGRLKDIAARNYYMARTKLAYALKVKGESATMINLLVKGEPEVAEKKLEFDAAVTRYEIAREDLMLKKAKAKMLEAQIDREWGASNHD